MAPKKDPADAAAEALKQQPYNDNPGPQPLKADKPPVVGLQPLVDEPSTEKPGEPTGNAGASKEESEPTGKRSVTPPPAKPKTPAKPALTGPPKPGIDEVQAVVTQLKASGTGKAKLQTIFDQHALATDLNDFMARLRANLPDATMQKMYAILSK